MVLLVVLIVGGLCIYVTLGAGFVMFFYLWAWALIHYQVARRDYRLIRLRSKRPQKSMGGPIVVDSGKPGRPPFRS